MERRRMGTGRSQADLEGDRRVRRARPSRLLYRQGRRLDRVRSERRWPQEDGGTLHRPGRLQRQGQPGGAGDARDRRPRASHLGTRRAHAGEEHVLLSEAAERIGDLLARVVAVKKQAPTTAVSYAPGWLLISCFVIG